MITNCDAYPENGDYLFRCYDFGGCVYCVGYEIVKETPKGCWIIVPNEEHNRFVLNGGNKRYAYETRLEAQEAFKYRKLSQYKILTKQLENCKLAYTQVGGTDERLRINNDMWSMP